MEINEVLNFLEDPDNQLYKQADYDDDKLIEVTELLTMASSLVRVASDIAYDAEDQMIADGLLDDLAAIANTFDQSGEELLIKKASVLDELLFSVAADKKILLKNKIAATQKLKDLREKFRFSQHEIEQKKLQQQLRKVNKFDKAEMVLKESGVLDEPKTESPMKYARETRNCPDHPGVMMYRVGDAVYQCSLDEKVYDYHNGFTMINGDKVPGASISNQNYFPDFEIPSWTKETKI